MGHHSLFYALHGAEVFSFEPNPVAIGLLRQKTAANSSLLIHSIQKGLSDREDCLALSIPDHANLGTASLEKAVGSRSVMVEVCCGDHMKAISQINRIDWIKIDVEGHELSVLLGLRQMITKHRPPVFFEWNGGGNFAKILSLFTEDYTFFRLEGDLIVAKIFAKPRYQLQPLPAGAEPPLCNVLAYPARQLPRHLSCRLPT